MIGQRDPAAAPVVRGVAESLPLREDAVDAALAVLTLHHWGDQPRACREMCRVARSPPVPQHAGKPDGPPKKLGELLLEHGAVTPTQIAEALEKQEAKPQLGEILVQSGVISQQTLGKQEFRDRLQLTE